LQKLALATAMAAGLLLFALVWGAMQWQPPKNPTPRPEADPLLASLMKRDLRLAQARNPKERVEALAALAADLHAESLAVADAASADDLNGLARMYDKVVRNGLVPQARDLRPEERARVLEPIVKQLERAGYEAGNVARDMDGPSRDAFATIAAAAEDAKGQLLVLSGGEKS
jgi:hypothetical protein